MFMGKIPTLILAFLLISAVTANTQTITTLQPGTPIERTLGPAQVHTFTVDLQENTYVQLVVEQRGIDVMVKVGSPSGKSLGEFDSPNGNDGPENVAFVALAAGSYSITVQPLDQNAAKEGRYEIKILEQRQATEQEVKTSQNVDVVKAKGLALLNDIDDIIAQIKSPPTRIRAQLQAAELLWESDEKRASKYLTDAVTGVKELLTTIDNSGPRYLQQYAVLSQLRHEIVQMLAARDPSAALAFLYSTVPPADPSGNRREQLSQENELEMMIVNQILQKDPIRALQIARQSLKKGYSSFLLNTLGQLQRQNPELASDFAGEIANKLLNEKLIKNQEAAMVALNLVMFARAPQRRSQPATPDLASSQKPLLPEDKYKELFQKIFNEALSYSLSSSATNGSERDAAWNLLNGLQAIGPGLDTVIAGGLAAVQKKIGELSGREGEQRYKIVQQYETEINNGGDNAVNIIEKAPPDLKEQLYLQLAQREFNNGDTARARQIINEHVTNQYQRREVLMSLEQQEIYRTVSKGRVEDALRAIGALRTPRERATHLANIASQIGPGQKRASAMNLLEQARGLLSPSPQAQDEDQMRALFEMSRAFARYDSKRAFEILDPLVDQVNDLCAAARTLEGFGSEYYEDDELNLQNGNTVANLAAQMSGVLGNLALINFDRAKSASDRIRLPEVRLRAYLEITQHTIQGK
jgi:hypothetical protein